MSDGGGEVGKESGEQLGRRRTAGSDEYGRAVARIAVAQICESVGFESFQRSALEGFSDVMIRYIYDLGKTASFCANLAGRTECNVFDIVQGLEELGLAQGFTGAADVDHCIAKSGAVQEIIRYVNLAKEVPFAAPITRFPVIKNPKATPSFLQIGEEPAGKHIPPWLPAFPDPHTYKYTSMWNERVTDPHTDRIEQARQRRKAERSLLRLQQRLAGDVSAEPSTVDLIDSGKASQAAENNPFLAPPLQFGEKDVSPVVAPVKLLSEPAVDNRNSVMETFAPVIEAAMNGTCDSGERKILPNKRPVVHFKIGSNKKSLCTPLDLTIQNEGVEKRSAWFGRDDEKDDKKRRAEQILKESMENPRELAQL
ncbi:hypothetical protein Syun_013254 [Stephania yunnanensis]|uniref:Transcription initiation factor TFIID subunit 8 n=1 Tax=Stephania yunnanensis TaxID=152371 RepID=A0AAP0K1Q8_9MAGN